MLALWNKYHMLYIRGVGYTVVLSLISLIISVLLGVVINRLKESKIKIVSYLATAYIELLRGTPLFVQMYIFYFGPTLLFEIDLSPFVGGLIAVSLNSSAYVAEIIRGGIQSVDPGQTEAGRSLGLTESQTMMKIIYPQAMKNILPSLGNEFISLIKETAIVSSIGVTDIMYGAKTAVAATYKVSGYMIAAGLYFVLTFTLSKILKVFERSLQHDS
ncbi:MAG: amino acid ABC transporter permease [Tissierellia bacterium]|nr:amino acid ABC transporter permease [Tissierellia bacterium]